MDNGYYSVSSILAESQTIQTKFLNKCPGLGYLNPDAGHQEVRSGPPFPAAATRIPSVDLQPDLGGCLSVAPRRVLTRPSAADGGWCSGAGSLLAREGAEPTVRTPRALLGYSIVTRLTSYIACGAGIPRSPRCHGTSGQGQGNIEASCGWIPLARI